MAGPFQIENVKLTDLPEGQFRVALQFWLDAKGEGILPPATAIDPLKIPRQLLPTLVVVSVEPGPKRLKFRLAGTAMVSATGVDLTGKFSEDVEGAEGTTQRVYAAIKSKTPYFYGGPLIWSPKDFKSYKALVMPFGNDAGEVTRFLGYNEFT